MSFLLSVGCQQLSTTDQALPVETTSVAATTTETVPGETTHSETMPAETTATETLPADSSQQAAAVGSTDCECPPLADGAVPVQPCPVVTPPPQQQCAVKEPDEHLLIGRVENVYLLPDNVKIKARIDTGAGICSLHVVNLVNFERDGKRWVKFSVPITGQDVVEIERPVKRYAQIKQQNGKSQRRPVIRMTLRLGAIEEHVEITLTDRSDYLYHLLIGRNFLRDRAIVDVSKKFTVQTPKQ
jgi:hypothetical protein